MSWLLLVDDDPVLLAARSAVLRGAGFDVVEVQSSDEALAMLLNPAQRPACQLVITDHVMPGASGLDFVREIRRISPSLPVVVVSGFSGSEQEYEGLEVAFLHKPCLPEELIEKVRGILNENHPLTL